MKTKQVLSLLIITLCGCSAIESPSALSITSQQISSNISHSAESVTDTPSVTITSSTQEDNTSKPTFNLSAELNPVSDNNSEEGYYRDDFNVLIPQLPEDITSYYTNCYELNKNNTIITIRYRLKNNVNYMRVSRYDRLEKKEILICNTPLEISGSPNFTAGEGNSFALIDDYCLIIVRDDQVIKTEKFESTGRRVISPDFKLIAHQNVEAHSYSIYNYETGETIVNFEKTHSAEPVFTGNGKFIFLDMEYDINVYDFSTGKTDQYEFGNEIWYLRYYEETNTLFLPDYDQIDESNSVTVYKLNLETGKLDEYFSIKNLKDGNLNNFDFNQKQFSYSQYSEKGYRVRTVGIYNEYSLVTEREFTAISKIKYCGSGFVVIQSLGNKMVLIYI